MSFQITARNVDLTDDIKDQIEKKIGKLNKFFDDTPDVHVTLRTEKFRQIVEITIFSNGLIVHGQTQTDDMFSALDGATDKVQHQIKKEKSRAKSIKSRKNQEMKKALNAVASEALPVLNEIEEIDQGERYSTEPISTHEALTSLKGSGGDFLLFVNSDTNEANLLQKKDDGRFWLVEPAAE